MSLVATVSLTCVRQCGCAFRTAQSSYAASKAKDGSGDRYSQPGGGGLASAASAGQVIAILLVAHLS